MFKVTWKVYGRIQKEKSFETEKAAKGFFYGYCMKARHITSARLETV